MRISDWSSDVCSSDLHRGPLDPLPFLFVFRNPAPRRITRTNRIHAAKLDKRLHHVAALVGGPDFEMVGFALITALVPAEQANEIGRASLGKECVGTSRSRWSHYH